MSRIISIECRLFEIPLAEVLTDAKHGEHTHFELVTATVTLDDGLCGTGYTFLFTISTAINQNRVLYKKMSYDPDKDFTYVSGFDAGHLPLAVAAGVKAANMREFVELAKRERVTMGNYSAGSYPHMVAQQMNKLYGTQVEAVHYKGEAPMWTDLAAGQITSALGSIGAMLPHLQSGKVRPIAVPTTLRSPRLPDVSLLRDCHSHHALCRRAHAGQSPCYRMDEQACRHHPGGFRREAGHQQVGG